MFESMLVTIVGTIVRFEVRHGLRICVLLTMDEWLEYILHNVELGGRIDYSCTTKYL